MDEERIWSGVLAGVAASRCADLDKWLKAQEVFSAAQMSKSGYYKAVAEGRAPGPDVKQGRRFARWKTSTIAAWLSDPTGWAERNRASLEGAKS